MLVLLAGLMGEEWSVAALLESPAVMGSMYALGSIAIVFGALATGWMIMWRCILVRMPFVREIFDLPAPKRKAY